MLSVLGLKKPTALLSTIINYSTAVDRLGTEHLTRISQSYYRAKGNEDQITREVFRECIISEEFPEMPFLLWSELWRVISSNRKQISLKEFISLIAVIMKGKRKEKIKLAFHMMNISNSGFLTQDELAEFLPILCEREIAAIDESGNCWDINQLLRHVFTFVKDNQDQYTSKVQLSQFAHSLGSFKVLCILDWMDIFGSRFNLPDTAYIQGDKYASALPATPHSITEFTRSQQASLDRSNKKDSIIDGIFPLIEPISYSKDIMLKLKVAFFNLRARFSTSKVGKNALLMALSDFFSIDFISKLYYAIEEGFGGKNSHLFSSSHSATTNKFVTLREFIVGLACSCHIDSKEAVHFLFQLFDNGNRGMLSKRQLIDLLVFMYPNSDNLLNKRSAPYQSTIKVIADSIFMVIFQDKQQQYNPETGIHQVNLIDFFQFKNWLTHHQDSLLFVKKVRGLVHVMFGDKPPTLREERHYIGSVYSQYNQVSPGPPGTDWFLISTNSWLHYLRHVGIFTSPSRANNTCSCNKQCKACCNLLDPVLLQLPDSCQQELDDGQAFTHINNSDLLHSSSCTNPVELRMSLSYPVDFTVVNFEVWLALSSWYEGSGPTITRTVVDSGANTLELEIFPLFLHLSLEKPQPSPSLSEKEQAEAGMSTSMSVCLSKTTTLASLRQIAFELYELPFDVSNNHQPVIRFWHRPNCDLDWSILLDSGSAHHLGKTTSNKLNSNDNLSSNKLNQIETNRMMRSTLTNLEFVNGHHILIEMPQKHPTSKKYTFLRPIPPTSRTPCLSDSSLPGEKKKTLKKTNLSRVGIVGLYNLGNTCFMNSALQCLIHTPLLKDYFCSEEYLYDINLHNSMGMSGQLAVAYGELVSQIWKISKANTSSLTAIAPRRFKQAIGRYNPQFEGIQQQDAQELLSVLLSGLNEDLSRLHSASKPFAELPDSDSRPDSIVANEWWSYHIQRDPSIITALFSGQFKSLLTCQKCSFESARFEPFSVLQLPLPEPKRVFVTITVFFSRQERRIRKRNSVDVPLLLTMDVDYHCVILDLIRCVCELDTVWTSDVIDKPPVPDELLLVELGNHYIYNILPKQKLVRQIQMTNNSTKLAILQLNSIERVNTQEQIVESDRIDAFSSDEVSSIKEVKLIRRPKVGEKVVVGLDYEGKSIKAMGQIHHISTDVVDEECQVGEDVDVEFLEGRYKGKMLSSHLDVFDGRLWQSCASKNKLDGFEDNSNDKLRRKKLIYLHIIHRRFNLKPFYFSNPLRCRIFCTPFIIQTPSKKDKLQSLTGKKLYEIVSLQLERYVGGGEVNVDKNTELKLVQDKKTVVESKEKDDVLFSSFRLSFVNRRGNACSRCKWFKKCIGCEIKPDCCPLNISNEETIAINWSKELLERFDESSYKAVRHHNSFIVHKKKEVNTLEECLDMFCTKEDVNAYCSQCTQLANSEYMESPQTKTLNIWALPPILIFQLKRFKSTINGNWHKVDNTVHFPIKNLNMSQFLSTAQNESCNKIKFEQHFSFSNLNFPEFTLSRTQTSYSLYGIVNHTGELGAGHYSSFVRVDATSGDEGVKDHETEKVQEKWWFFDDGNFEEFPINDLKPSSTEYLLFYVRKDIEENDIHEIFPRRENATKVNLEELQDLWKKWEMKNKNDHETDKRNLNLIGFEKVWNHRCSFM